MIKRSFNLIFILLLLFSTAKLVDGIQITGKTIGSINMGGGFCNEPPGVFSECLPTGKIISHYCKIIEERCMCDTAGNPCVDPPGEYAHSKSCLYLWNSTEYLNQTVYLSAHITDSEGLQGEDQDILKVVENLTILENLAHTNLRYSQRSGPLLPRSLLPEGKIPFRIDRPGFRSSDITPVQVGIIEIIISTHSPNPLGNIGLSFKGEDGTVNNVVLSSDNCAGPDENNSKEVQNPSVKNTEQNTQLLNKTQYQEQFNNETEDYQINITKENICSKNSECTPNFCIDNKCKNLGILQRFSVFLRRLFGRE
ncbi:MAG: hypothetical protein Q7S74_03570 [Nanoarchaeota archaeon]|nr:hypothetical protein [Nanoarchaeota archaeon]